MYFYLYDEFLSHKKYQSAIDKIETRLTDLEIKHKITRLSILKNIKGIIEDEVRRGAETIVVVGDDQTVFKAINVLAHHPDVALGIIPVGNQNNIAKILGIPPEQEACDILSSRIIKRLDLGRINHHYFISEITIEGRGIRIRCNDSYSITPADEATTRVYNFNFNDDFAYTNPQDGVLELFIQGQNPSLLSKLFSKETKQDISLFPFTHAEITTDKEPAKLIIDRNHTIKTPAHVEIMPKKLKVIVGKNRLFE